MHRQKVQRSEGERHAARKPGPMDTGHRRALQAAAAVMMVVGVVILLKVVLAVQSGTAWDDLETSSRDTQPFEFWSFVVTYFLMGCGLIWMSVNAWRTR
jgi:uncharacterized BrkB/YihY/UPF0761 family membrane protein